MIETVVETGSTNADLAARLSGGDLVREGDWLIADRQSSGHGRLGRAWADGAGNFMGSTVVRPGHGDPSPATLALVAGIAVFEAVRDVGCHDKALSLKWPNDVLLCQGKLAGILLEGVAGAVVVGIGVNLVTAPEIPGRSTASLAECGCTVSRDAFGESLAASIAKELDRWRSVGTAPLIRRWLAAAHPIGTALTVDEADGSRSSGTFAGLDSNGALQLRDGDGTVRTIHAGDVLLSPPQA